MKRHLSYNTRFSGKYIAHFRPVNKGRKIVFSSKMIFRKQMLVFTHCSVVVELYQELMQQL